MKKRGIYIALFFAVITGISAQENLPEMCMAIECETSKEGVYVTHPTHPFGTKLLITNMITQLELEVLVGGRPENKFGGMIEVCELAAFFLGMEPGVLTQVRVVVIEKPASQLAMRPRLAVSQTGRAVVLSSGDELIALHASLPVNSQAVLTNTANKKKVTVTIKGRLQASKDRIVEISPAAAKELGIKDSAEVHLESVK
ncbi:MAG: septal ring lytic transglycosylase RlpA family protein [Treponema sp.]|jgi:rare lipoprotein A (peptidoglycan hydrolase)|nr:septal ring lytic transglycosylase RlpA family protein [Treponema sp.]